MSKQRREIDLHVLEDQLGGGGGVVLSRSWFVLTQPDLKGQSVPTEVKILGEDIHSEVQSCVYL